MLSNNCVSGTSSLIVMWVSLDFIQWYTFQDPPDWTEILTYFRGSELQNFFTKILEDDLKAIIKPQYVDQIPKAVKVRFHIFQKFKINRIS